MKKLTNWLPAIIVMSIIFFLSSLPGETVDSTIARNNSIQMTGHFFLFMFLCVSYFKVTKNIVLSILLTLLYAIFDEIHQLFTPARSSSLNDIVVDMMGASISGFFLWKILPNLPKKLKNLLIK